MDAEYIELDKCISFWAMLCFSLFLPLKNRGVSISQVLDGAGMWPCLILPDPNGIRALNALCLPLLLSLDMIVT